MRVADRAVRQVAEQVRAGRLPAGHRLARRYRRAPRRTAASSPAAVRGRRTPGSGRPCTAASRRCRARCARRAPRRRRRARGRTSKPVARASRTLGDNVVPRLRVFSGGNETCQARGHPATPLPAIRPLAVYLSANSRISGNSVHSPFTFCSLYWVAKVVCPGGRLDVHPAGRAFQAASPAKPVSRRRPATSGRSRRGRRPDAACPPGCRAGSPPPRRPRRRR